MLLDSHLTSNREYNADVENVAHLAFFAVKEKSYGFHSFFQLSSVYVCDAPSCSHVFPHKNIFEYAGKAPLDP